MYNFLVAKAGLEKQMKQQTLIIGTGGKELPHLLLLSRRLALSQ
jgi:hypothetical protein